MNDGQRASLWHQCGTEKPDRDKLTASARLESASTPGVFAWCFPSAQWTLQLLAQLGAPASQTKCCTACQWTELANAEAKLFLPFGRFSFAFLRLVVCADLSGTSKKANYGRSLEGQCWLSSRVAGCGQGKKSYPTATLFLYPQC